jgi:ketosteroid isomerase-like protein
MSNSKQAANKAQIQKLYDAFATGDVPTVLAGLSPEIVWNEAENFIYADGNPYVGHDAILSGVFMRLGGEWEGFHLSDIRLYGADDDGVLATGRYRGRHNATGKELDAQFAHLWKLKDSLVVSFQQFTDTLQAAAVSGMVTA